jgi:ornithine cyclodeaminase
MQTPILDDAAVASALDYRSVETTLVEALTDLAAGQAQPFARQRIDCGEVKLSAMGGIWLARQVAGIKSYPTVGGQFNFVMSLFDLREGGPLVTLPGGELTRFRTAALAVLAARRMLAKPHPRIALFGFGVQGHSIAQALADLKPAHLAVVDPGATAERIAAFARNVDFAVQPMGAQDAVGQADLVVTATRSKAPVFDGAWLRPGASVVAIGTSLPTGRELDDTTMRRATRVLVEWKPQSLVEAGEVVLAQASGALQGDEKIADLAEIFAGHAPWRAGADEIVVFKSVGLGLCDVAAAWLAASRLVVQAR